MKPERLSELLQNIDDSLIARAGRRRKKSRAAIIRIAAVCACLALIMTVTLRLALTRPEVFNKSHGTDKVTTDNADPESEMPDTDMPEGSVGSPSDGATVPEDDENEGTDGATIPEDDGNEGSDESDRLQEDGSDNQNSSPQNKPTADDAGSDKTGSSAGTSTHTVTQASDPYPYLTKNIKFKCGSYIIEQYNYPNPTKDLAYLVNYADSGAYSATMQDTRQVDFDGIPIIPYAARTVLKSPDFSNFGVDPYEYVIFRGIKSGASTQYVSVTDMRRLVRYAHTPVSVTHSVHGKLAEGDTVKLTENAAVVEYEGKEHILCADGYPPIKKDTEYIFMLAKTFYNDPESDIYRPMDTRYFCIFEITDEVKAAKSADELYGLSDAEKEIYQKYYYDTL